MMALKHIFGDVPMIRVLDFMLDHIELDSTVKEMVEYADVATGAVKRDLPPLVECGMVVETRKIGGVQLYALNQNSPITTALIEFDDKVATIMSEDIADEEKLYPEAEEQITIPDFGIKKVSEIRAGDESIDSAEFSIPIGEDEDITILVNEEGV